MSRSRTNVANHLAKGKGKCQKSGPLSFPVKDSNTQRPSAESLPLRYLFANPARTPAQVEHKHHSRLILGLKVIDAEGETARQHPKTAILP